MQYVLVDAKWQRCINAGTLCHQGRLVWVPGSQKIRTGTHRSGMSRHPTVISIVFPGRFNLGTMGPREFVTGHVL